MRMLLEYDIGMKNFWSVRIKETACYRGRGCCRSPTSPIQATSFSNLLHVVIYILAYLINHRVYNSQHKWNQPHRDMTRIEKGIAKSFSCNFCQRKFARNEHLQRHVRTRKHIVMSMYRTHSTLTQPKDTKEKPFACPCGHTFTRLDLLKRHNRISHGGQPLSEQADETIPERHEIVSHSTPSSEEYSGPVQHPQAGFDHESERSPRDTSAQISARRYGNCNSVCASAVDVAQSVARLSPTDDSGTSKAYAPCIEFLIDTQPS